MEKFNSENIMALAYARVTKDALMKAQGYCKDAFTKAFIDAALNDINIVIDELKGDTLYNG